MGSAGVYSANRGRRKRRRVVMLASQLKGPAANTLLHPNSHMPLQKPCTSLAVSLKLITLSNPASLVG